MNQVEAIGQLRELLPPESTFYAIMRGRPRGGGSVWADFFAVQLIRDPSYSPPKVTTTRMIWINPHLIALGVLPADCGRYIRGKGIRIQLPVDEPSFRYVSAVGNLLYGNTSNGRSLRLEWL